jgi:hypothetical protein
MRGNSTFMERLARDVGDEIRVGKLKRESGKETLQSTREKVVREWELTATRLDAHGERLLAEDVRSFAGNLPPPRTDREWVAAGILAEIVRRDERARTPVRSSPQSKTRSQSPESPDRSR